MIGHWTCLGWFILADLSEKFISCENNILFEGGAGGLLGARVKKFTFTFGLKCKCSITVCNINTMLEPCYV